MAALVGFRVTTVDPKAALFFRAYEFSDQKKNATSILSKTARDPNKVSDDTLKSAFNRASKARKQAYSDMLKIVSAARQSGLSTSEIYRILISNNVAKKDAMHLSKGRTPRWLIGKTAMAGSIKKAGVLFDVETRRSFEKRLRLMRQWAAQEAR